VPVSEKGGADEGYFTAVTSSGMAKESHSSLNEVDLTIGVSFRDLRKKVSKSAKSNTPAPPFPARAVLPDVDK